jgi:Domain of unknown function (DUF4123)
MSALLMHAITALAPAHFAVMCGTMFDDLPAVLDASNLGHVPLYLEAENAAGLAAGPHLVALPSLAHAETVVRIASDRCAMVFWSWPGSIDTLRRHLRGLNLVTIPSESGMRQDTVIFRHWDPNVLAVTLPELTANQQSRFLGNSGGLTYNASEHGGVVNLARPDGLPPPSLGILQFNAAQLAATNQRRLSASFLRIATYMRDVASAQTASMTDQSLLDTIGQFDFEARSLGLTTEQDVARWSFLQLLTGRSLLEDANVLGVFAATDVVLTPSERLDRLLASVEHGLGSAS